MARNETTVTKNGNGQYTVTIPKAMAEARDLAGKVVAWKPESATKLSMEPTDD